MSRLGEIQGSYNNFFDSAHTNKAEKNNDSSFQNTLAELVNNVEFKTRVENGSILKFEIQAHRQDEICGKVNFRWKFLSTPRRAV